MNVFVSFGALSLSLNKFTSGVVACDFLALFVKVVRIIFVVEG